MLIALKVFIIQIVILGNSTRAELIDQFWWIKFFSDMVVVFSFLIIAGLYFHPLTDNRVAVGYNGKYQDLTSLRNYYFLLLKVL